MTIDANGKRDSGLQEANGHLQTVAGINEAGNSGERMSHSRGEGLRLNRIENVKHECEEAMQLQQQRSQGSMVHWEKLLHISTIKVLLVENDDSTRHVVAALLHNLNYEVIVAANGLQAWRIIEDLTSHIDVVLTEVVMPCLSGIALLCKIMSHKTRKTVPVIMMSSHDSMGLVFKCLSKGAVDLLGKPVRKNELKNLWQHVWRRCHSSSWTKEVDSSRAMTAKDHIAKHSYSSCAQLCSKAETSTKFPVAMRKGYQGIDNVRHGRGLVLGIGKPYTRELQLNNTTKVPFKLLNTNRIIDPVLDPDSNKMSRVNNPENHSPFNKDKYILTRTPSPHAASEDHAKTVDTTSDKLKATSAINDLNLTSVFAPTELDLNFPPQQVILVKTDDLASRALLTPIRGSPSEFPVQHIHHHHHVHHFHRLDRDQSLSNLEKLPYKKPEESLHLRPDTGTRRDLQSNIHVYKDKMVGRQARMHH